MINLPPPRKITSNIQPPKPIKKFSDDGYIKPPSPIPDIIHSNDLSHPLKTYEDQNKNKGKKIFLTSTAIVAGLIIIGSINSKPTPPSPVIEVAPITEYTEETTESTQLNEAIPEPVEEITPIVPEPEPIVIDPEPVAPTPIVPEPISNACDPNYSPCVPIDTDVDCAGGGGNGPSYLNGSATVIGVDVYDLDRDGDGIACN